MGTEIQEMYSEMDALRCVAGDNTEELKKLTGQGEGGGDRVGLPRLGINYDQETEDGNPLVRGHWKIMVDGEFLYAPEVKIQSLMRMFEYSVGCRANEGRADSRASPYKSRRLAVRSPTQRGVTSVVASLVTRRRTE